LLLSGTPTIYTVDLTTDNGPTSAGTGSGTTGDLRFVINLANSDPNPAGTMIEFDPTVFATAQTITLSPTLGTLVLSNSAGPEVIDGPGTALATISGGGAIGVFSIAPNVTVTMTGVAISGGAADQAYNPPPNEVQGRGSSGGAIFNQGNLTIANDVFSNDSAVVFGGAIYNIGGTATITNSTFANNTATNGLGGAIDNAGALAVTNSTFTGGDAFQGGAIDNKSGGSLVVTNSSFSLNVAIMGGAIFNDATATVYGSTIANNTAVSGSTTSVTSFDGGAIANDLNGVMTLTNSTIANNAASQAGGGIVNVGVLTAVNDTIAYNTTATGSGGGVYAPFGTTTLDNTIIALNTIGTGTTATASDIAGNVSLLSANNLIGSGSGGLTSGTAGNLIGVANPGLGVLASNGGPTQTIALLAGSPAIDAGSNALAVNAQGTPLVFDQRGVGFARIVNSVVDIGAFERFLSTTAILKSSANPSTFGQAVTFTVTVSPSGSSTQIPTGAVIIFDGVIPLTTLTLVNGTASFTTSALPIGANAISVVYSGDMTFATSNSTPISQVVNAAAPVASVVIGPTTNSLALQSSAMTTLSGISAVKVSGTSSSSSTTAAPVPGPFSVVVKKAVGRKKALPDGGSSTTFHQSTKTAILKRTLAVATKHAKTSVKQAKFSVKKK
jgi:hypothetical protein